MNIPRLSCSSFFPFINRLNIQKNKPIIAIISLIALSILALYGLHRIMRKIILNGHTPLTQAAQKGDLAGVRKLVSKGASINQTNQIGHSPLHTAALHGHSEIVEYLIQAGCDPEPLDNDSRTPAMFAYNSSHKQLGDWLIKQEKNQTSRLSIQQHSLFNRFGYYYYKPNLPCHGNTLISSHDSLVRSLKQTNQWINKGPPGWTINDTAYIYKTLEKGIELQDLNQLGRLAESMDAHLKGEIIVIPVNYKTKKSAHAVTIVIYKNLLIKGDRGDYRDNNLQPGLSIYKINHSAKLEEAIKKLIKGRQENSDFFKKGIDQMLDLEPIHHLRHSSQKTPTCTWTSSAKLSFHSVLYLYLIKQGFTEKEAEDFSQSMYKTWVQEDRQLAIQEIFSSQLSETVKKDLLASAFLQLSIKKDMKKKPDKEYAETDKLQALIKQQEPEILKLKINLAREVLKELDLEIKKSKNRRRSFCSFHLILY